MRVLIPLFTGIGNYILKKETIRQLNQSGYLVSVSIYCDDVLSKLIDQVDEKIEFKKNKTLDNFHLFFKSRNRFDSIFMFFDSTPSWFLLLSVCLCRGAKLFVSSNIHSRSLKHSVKYFFINFVGKNIYYVPLVIGRHEKEINNDFVQYLKFFDNKKGLVEGRDIYFRGFKKNCATRNVIIQTSTANGNVTCKNWHPKKWSELINRIAANYNNFSILIVGDKGDLRSHLLDYDPSDNIKDLRGKTTITEISDLIANSHLVISGDSGLMHMADEMEVNLIALYGPTDFTRTGPMGLHSKCIFSDHPSFLTLYDFRNSELDIALKYPNYECLSLISIDSVYSEVEKCLGK